MANPNVQKVPKLLLQLNEWQAQGRLDKAHGQTLNGQRDDRAGRADRRGQRQSGQRGKKEARSLLIDRSRSHSIRSDRSDPIGG